MRFLEWNPVLLNQDFVEVNNLQKPISEFWYAIRPCEQNIVQLREACIDPYLAGNIWFVRGTSQSLVIDTGTGMVSPVPILSCLTDGPLLAVACNGWYDHAGGLHFFEERACHELEQEIITEPTAETSAASVYVNDDMLLALPHEDFRINSYRMHGAKPTKTLKHGELIDLGNRQFEIIHVPGITPGSIVVWEEATGSLFTSDTLYCDPLNGERDAEQLEPVNYNDQQYKESLMRIRDLPVTMVYPGHFACFGREKMLEIIDDLLQ
jgi:glyoxylase-like metal-dependent hydrolase (beta-lactamase superfamily II)